MRSLIHAFILLLATGNLAMAEDVKLQHKGLTLNANLEKTDGDWKKMPVLLMTHGTLAHSKMEIMQTLQGLFKDQGYSSLSINLGLGINDRKGMYDCNVPHTHQHTDALDEIGLWLDWLKKRGATSIVLLGHSRGGNQTAWFVSEYKDPAIRSAILIAPAMWSAEYARKDYKRRYKKDLDTVLAKAQKLVDAGKGDTMMKPVDFIYCKEASASARAIVGYYSTDARRDTPTLLPKITVPTLVFAGSEDKVVAGLDKKIAPLVAEKGNIQLEVIDGSDHFFRDLYAEDLVDMAVEFIGE